VDIAYYIPPPEKVGGTRPPCPPPNCAHAVHVYERRRHWNRNKYFFRA